jgi:hypothetical protein
LIVSVGRRALGGLPQGGDHGSTCNVKVIGITVEIENRPEGTTIMKARVQVLDVCSESIGGGGDSFFVEEGKEPYDS